MNSNKMIPGKIIFKAITGSQAHGTATETSDTDIKGIYLQPNDDLLTFDYVPFYSVNKDENYYELNRFIELLSKSNPDALELIKCEETVLLIEPEFQILKDNYKLFLTKKCKDTFGNYAKSQINKATGRDKMINWEKDRVERKDPLDFTYEIKFGKTYPIKEQIEDQKKWGLVKIDKTKNIYGAYEDIHNEGYRGMLHENGNELRTSIISKSTMNYETPKILFFNQEAYSTHCKDYKNYQAWLKNRNEVRFNTNMNHAQNYDSKNISHCFRLTNIAEEIAKTGDFSIKRPNVDYLLQIKRGEVDLEEILNYVNNSIETLLNDLYEKSDLPDDVDMNKVKEIILKIRHYNK